MVSLAKADAGTHLDVGAMVKKLVPVYVELLQLLKEMDVPEVLLTHMLYCVFQQTSHLRVWPKADFCPGLRGRIYGLSHTCCFSLICFFFDQAGSWTKAVFLPGLGPVECPSLARVTQQDICNIA